MLMRYRPGTGLDARILTAAEMRSRLSGWEDLCRRSLEDSVYYTPRYAGALLDTTASQDHPRFVTVSEGERLVALLPVETARLPVPGLAAAGQAWMTDYTFSTLPLIDRNLASDAAGVLLEGLGQLSGGEWVFPAMTLDGPSARALMDAMELRGIPWAAAGDFTRATIARGPGFEEHLTERIGSKRRRELARNRRRLEELGKVSHETHCNGAELNRAVQAFLDLETSGWKGRRGTALACDPATRDFARAAFGDAGGQSICRADLLLLDGKPIAAGLIVFAGRTGFTVKGAYDERYARYGAGLLLEMEVLRSFLEEGWADRLDAATAGEHVIDQLWPGRMRVGSLVFSLAPRGAALRLRSLTGVMAMKQQAKDTLKRLIKR